MTDQEKLNTILKQLQAVNQAFRMADFASELLKLSSLLQIIGESHDSIKQADEFSVHDTHSQRDGE